CLPLDVAEIEPPGRNHEYQKRIFLLPEAHHAEITRLWLDFGITSLPQFDERVTCGLRVGGAGNQRLRCTCRSTRRFLSFRLNSWSLRSVRLGEARSKDAHGRHERLHL